MALFKKIEKKEVKAETTAAQSTVRAGYSHILKNPRITEKATAHALMSSYVFDVAPSATKRDIMHAVKELYKVTPRFRTRPSAVPAPARRASKAAARRHMCTSTKARQ